MELTCALVVSLVSLAAATPHGYGVKGGALAKADASAVAGAYGGFGEAPLSIPSGAGYSGSYSKSSSSSFASSSASSSASSYSFSGSGPGVSGFGANVGASGGCTSGKCLSSGIQDSRGAGSTGNGQAYSGAKATASAGAVAVAGSQNGNQPCTGGSCSNGKPSACDGCDVSTTEKCTSGQCAPGSSNGKPSKCDGCDVSSTNNKCTSDQCGSASLSTSSSNQYDSNKKCASGNCQQTSQSDLSSATDNDIPAFVALEKKPTSEPNGQAYEKSTAFAGAGGAATVQNHDKPSTHLTAPKEGPACTTATCDLPTTGTAYDKENLPSSYNVPIHGNYPGLSSQGKGPCTSGNCASTQPNTPHPLYQVPSSPSASDSCVTGNCGSKIPSHSQGASPAYVPTGSANCGSSNCGGIPSNQPNVIPSSHSKYPSYSELPSNAPFANAGALAGSSAFAGSFSATKPIPASQKLPAYTGGFGGPKGILNPNEFNNPSSIPTSGYKPTATIDTHYPAPCSTGNCGPGSSQSKPQYGQSKPTVQGVNYNLPSCSSGTCGPQSEQLSPHYDHIGSNTPTQPTGGFGGPAGILKPNDFSTPINAPVYNHKPTASTVGISPTSCNSGTCRPQSSATSPQYDQSIAPSGSQYNPTAPTGTYNHVTCSSGNCGTQPSQSYQPPYTQSAPKPTAPIYGFGGPPGILKPNDYNTVSVPTSNYKPTSGTYNPASSISSYAYGSAPSETQSALASAGSLVSCSSANCGVQPSQSVSPYAQNGLKKPLNPASCSSGNCEDQPNLLSAPKVTYNSAPCTSGNCRPQTSQPLSQNPSQFGPSGSPTSSGAYYPTHFSGSAAGAIAGASAVAYTRGFGGPPGLLKPYDDGKLGSSDTTGFSNNYAGSQLSSQHSSAPGGGVYSPHGKSSTGAGSGALAGSGAQANAVAGAGAGAYNGGSNLQGDFNNKENLRSEHQTAGRCKDDCGSNGGGANFGLNGGFPDGLNGFNTASAAAKSVASAGAGSYGLGGSFASSSASAHASAGVATKGGYGRR